ncbi:MAG: hypothetical protein ACKOCH_06210, partial [Bacteroidota bacterium]
PTPAFPASSGWVSFTAFRLSFTKTARFILYLFGYKNKGNCFIYTLLGVLFMIYLKLYPKGCNLWVRILQEGQLV